MGIRKAAVAAIICGILAGAGAFALDAAEILAKADSALVPKNAEFKWSLLLQRKGEPDKENRFVSFKKGDLKYLFYTYSPASSFGQSHMRIDSTIWIYLPLADDTVKTSYKSAFLNSGLSYADVMYNELSRYYDARLLGSGETARGIDGEHVCWKLELTAKKGADGYARIIAWIDATSFLTVRREYYTLSGQKLKEIAYGGFAFEGNAVNAFSLVIDNTLNPDEKTTAKFWGVKSRPEMPEKYFSLNYVKSWQPEIEE
jgi:outer membrane lipoprotein-sorting protein